MLIVCHVSASPLARVNSAVPPTLTVSTALAVEGPAQFLQWRDISCPPPGRGVWCCSLHLFLDHPTCRPELLPGAGRPPFRPLHAPLRGLEVGTLCEPCHVTERMQAAPPKTGAALSCATSAIKERTMQTYNVHIYREMRLFFPGIVASTAEEAARLAAEMPSGAA